MQFISQGSLLAGPLFAGIVIGKMSDNAYVLMALASIAALFLFSRVKYKEKQGQAEVPEGSRQLCRDHIRFNLNCLCYYCYWAYRPF